MIPGFISLPIKLMFTDKITDQKTYKDVQRKMLAVEVWSYGATFDDEFPDLDVTYVSFRNGESVHAYLSEGKFETLLLEALTVHSKVMTWPEKN
jgi:hypothetical protein